MLNAVRWLIASNVPRVAQVALGECSLFGDETSQKRMTNGRHSREQEMTDG